MRILHLITRMDAGGSAVNTLICATHQARAGNIVILAYGPSTESEMSDEERNRVESGLQAFLDTGGQTKVLTHLQRRPGLHDWHAYREILALMGLGFDVVHTHTSKAGALGRITAWGRAKTVVHTPHGHIFHGYFGRMMTVVFVTIERWLAKRTHVLIALTEAERNDHLRMRVGKPEQWHVVPSGVDVLSVRERVQALRRSKAEWHAVSVGRLVSIKGMDRLIRAWARVCEQKPDAHLAIIGDGPEYRHLQRLRDELGLLDRVHFAGWADPLSYLANSNCFVLLSHNEGMGRAVVEAMAAGLPCIVSDVCGLRELVDEHVGIKVNADNAGEVASALLTHWSNEVRQAAVERARLYAMDAMIEGLDRIYEECVNHA